MNAETPLLMDQVQYAKHRNKTKQYINKLVKAGVMVMRGSKIDVRASDQVLDDKPLPEIPDPAPGDAAPQRTTYAEARTIRTVFQAKLARLDFETKEGKLIEADAVRARISQHIAAITAGLDGMVDRLAPRIAREPDRRKVHAMLGAEIRRQLVEIAGVIGGRQEQGGEDDRKTHDVPVP